MSKQTAWSWLLSWSRNKERNVSLEDINIRSTAVHVADERKYTYIHTASYIADVDNNSVLADINILLKEARKDFI